MAFWINVHGCQLHPKIAIYIVKQLKNYSFRQGLYTKRNDRKVSKIKDESFECLILKSSNLFAFGLVGFLFGLTLTLCFCCFVDAEVEKKKILVQSRKCETFKDQKLSPSVSRFFYNLFQNIYMQLYHPISKDWYFVTIIVLTYCEKKLFQCEEKKLNREIFLQIRGRKAENL